MNNVNLVNDNIELVAQFSEKVLDWKKKMIE